MTDPVRCAPWTLAQGIDPAGSAVPVDRLVLVEIPLPWPRDIADAAWLSGITAPAGARLQAIVPESPHPDGAVMITRWDKRGAHYDGTDWLVPPTQVPGVVASVVAGDDPDTPGAPSPAEILVCGHGARDACCGGAGTRLAVEARAALAEWRVRRTSHLGGHRFAPTALCLPDGRTWAYLDADALVGIVRRTLDPVEARARFRGHTGLGPWAQVAEADRLLAAGWDAHDVDQLDAEVSPDGDDAADVTLRWETGGTTGQHSARVVVRRRYPVVACGLEVAQATKSAAEYEVV